LWKWVLREDKMQRKAVIFCLSLMLISLPSAEEEGREIDILRGKEKMRPYKN
jgi:hypothetical protein